jgi:ankyrin repeat protein
MRRAAVEDGILRCDAATVDWLFAAADGEVNAGTRNAAVRAAARAGHVDILQAFLADPRFDPGSGGNAALRWAAKRGHADACACLLSYRRVHLTAGIDTAMEWAVSLGHTETVRQFLGCPRFQPQFRHLTTAVDACQLPVLRVLLEDGRCEAVGADPSCDSLLARAAFVGDSEVVRLLLRMPRVRLTDAAVMAAVENRHTEALRALLQDPRAVPVPALSAAARWGHLECVRILLAAMPGFPRNDAEQQHAAAALHDACARGHVSIVRVLLQGGVDPALRSDLFLFRAGTWLRSRLAIVRLLLQDGRVRLTGACVARMLSPEYAWPEVALLLVADIRWRQRRCWVRAAAGDASAAPNLTTFKRPKCGP